MNARLGRALLLIPGTAAFLLILLVPALALVFRSVELGRSDAAPALIAARQWTLFGRSVYLAAGGAAGALVLSLPAAYVVGRIGRLSRAPAIGALLLAPLLLPPMVYAFGWQRIGLPSLGGALCCVWVWASWGWPIPATLIGTGWARAGREAYEAAILVTTPTQAFGRVVLPLLLRQASLALLILFVIFLGDYSVPHSCSLVVLGTELLGWAAQSNRPADVLVPAIPLIAVVVAALAVVVGIWRRPDETHTDVGLAESRRAGCLAAVPIALVGLTVAVPIGALAVRFGAWRVMSTAWHTYGSELAASLGVAVSAGVVAVGIGLSLGVSDRLRRWAVPVAVLAGVLPAALAGEAVLMVYQHVRAVYNCWLLLLVGYVARYAWVGLLTAWLAKAATSPDLIAQARTDGATETSITLRLRYLPNAAVLLAGIGLATAMALADVAVGTMLTVPGIGPISAILLEKFHRLEDGMLVALSLWLVIGAVPAAVLAWVALRLGSYRAT